MTFNSNIKIAIIAEDMAEIVIGDKDEGIKNSELNWHLADHLLKNQNDIEAIASEEMISIRSKVIPIDTQKIEIGISTFDFSSMKKLIINWRFQYVMKTLLELILITYPSN